jgi:DNA primase
MVIGRTTNDVGPEDFLHPTYRAVWELVASRGGPLAGAADPNWSGTLRDAAPDPQLASLVSALTVEPLPSGKAPDASYVAQHVVRLLELTALRRIAAVKSKLQRTNPVDEPETYNRMFGELAALEAHRRALRDRIVGTE